MKKLLVSALCLLHFAVAMSQSVIDLKGTWQFQIDRTDAGISQQWFANRQFDDTILLPGSMTERLKGDDISVKTKWVGSLYDSSFFFNPYMEKYRRPGKDMKLTFFLTPPKHYVGVAWYRRTVNVNVSKSPSRYILYLERPHIQTTLWVNGHEVGSQRSLVTAHQYDVTDFIINGGNDICIRIDNRIETVNVGQDSHSVTDQTQGDWNGIVGKMELRQVPEVHITDVQVFPDIETSEALVKMQIVGKKGKKADIDLTALLNSEPGLSPAVTNTASSTRHLRQIVRLVADTTAVELHLAMGQDCPLWDEFHPNLFTLTAQVIGKGKTVDERQVTFGMRKFEIRGKMFFINNTPIQLRGTVENCCFPLTGYAPMDVESWMKVFRRCKEFGLNHMRFHSYCPPEAAFIAADRVGFYLQPEGPSWPNHGVRLGYGDDIDTYLLNETQRMSRDYGNHPSFCMMACGNEPAGRWVEWVGRFVDYWKATDSRRLYTGASVGGGWAWQPKNQYHVKAGARGLNWTSRAPQSMDDYASNISRYGGKDVPGGCDIHEPYVSHETGQWCAFPDFDEISKYTGVYKARNFEVFSDILRDNGMESMAHKFLMASGKLQTLCYKYEIERTLRTPDYAGFQLLSINDYSGQGTALVGVTNVFFDDKPYTSSAEFREFCSEIVPLARIPKFTYQNTETFTAELLLNQFSGKMLKGVTPRYTFTDAQGRVIASSDLHCGDLPMGQNISLGTAMLPLSGITTAQRLTLTVSIPGTTARNHWNFWVYPFQAESVIAEPRDLASATPRDLKQLKSKTTRAAHPANLWITDQFDEKTMQVLQSGGNVLIAAAGKVTYGKEVVQQFTPVFWNTSWFKMRPPHTTGIYVEDTHSIFDLFPTDYHSDLQWWELVNKAQVMQFDHFPRDFQPLVQSIDTWFLSRKIGMLFEANVLNGKVVMTTMDITSDLTHRLAARQMRRSIIKYMESDSFHPQFTLDPQLIADLFTREAPKVNMYTNQSPDELKPKLK